MKTKLTLTVFVTILFSTLAFAIPVPHAFYGTVTINEAPAPDGTVITAQIDGVEMVSTTTSDGKYGYPPGDFYINDPENEFGGETIYFFVDGNQANDYSFCLEFACVTKLDLTVTITTPTTTPPAGGGGGGSGGGGGGSPTTTTTTTTIVTGDETTTTTITCQEAWTCSDWSSCKDEIKTRTCTDQNECGTEENKPFESQPCTAEEAAAGGNAITGMLISALSNPVVAFILIVIVLVVLYIIWKLIKKPVKSGKKPTYNYKHKK